MLKIILRTIVILLAAGLVAGGIYLLVERGGLGFLDAGRIAEGALAGRPGGGMGRGFRAGESGIRPERGGFEQGELPDAAEFIRGERGHDEAMGFSLSGLPGVLRQAGKVALITLVIVVVQWVWRLLRRRRRQPAAEAAAAQ